MQPFDNKETLPPLFQFDTLDAPDTEPLHRYTRPLYADESILHMDFEINEPMLDQEQDLFDTIMTENTDGESSSMNNFVRSLQSSKQVYNQFRTLLENNEINSAYTLAQETELDSLMQFSQHTKDELSILHYAIMKNALPLVSLLLDKGMSIWSTDATQSNALHYAAHYQHESIVALLLSKVMPGELHRLKDVNIHMQTAFDIATSGGNEQIINAFISAENEPRELLLDTIPAFHEIAFHNSPTQELNDLMIQNREQDAINLAKIMTLEQLQAFPSLNKFGMTFLEFAVLLKMKDLVVTLANKGISVLEQDLLGNTALHCAVCNRDNAMIDTLKTLDINHDVMFNITNRNGLSPIALANMMNSHNDETMGVSTPVLLSRPASRTTNIATVSMKNNQ